MVTPQPPDGPQPPSLSEVMHIVQRRRRTRRRVGRGAALATLVVGVGISVDVLLAGEPSTVEPLPPAAGVPESTTTSTTALTLPSPGVDADAGCPDPDSAAAAASLLESGRETYLARVPLPDEETAILAEEWQLPLSETKALAGLYLGAGEVFDASVIDDAIISMDESGYSAGDLEVVAEEWGTSLAAVKILAHLGTPEIEAVLGPCLSGRDR